VKEKHIQNFSSEESNERDHFEKTEALLTEYRNASSRNTERLIMFSVITNTYNKKTKGPTLMDFFTATGKLKRFFLTTRDVRRVHHG
jgi:hypothetical protein